jgi:hypothetical protein
MSGCNQLITFNSNGSIATTTPNASGFYDAGGDDSLIGVINNTGTAITSIVLASTVFDIFGFDFDGVCGAATTGAGSGTPGYTFVGGGNPCGAVDPTGYGDHGITFSGISLNGMSGTVTFPASQQMAARRGSRLKILLT